MNPLPPCMVRLALTALISLGLSGCGEIEREPIPTPTPTPPPSAVRTPGSPGNSPQTPGTPNPSPAPSPNWFETHLEAGAKSLDAPSLGNRTLSSTPKPRK